MAATGLQLDVKVVRVTGVEAAPGAGLVEGSSLFVRYYVSVGDGKRRLRVDTREVTCGDGGDAFWGELARFELAGHGAAAAVVAAGTPGKIAFDLRLRPRAASGGLAALLGRTRRAPSSRVLARAELAVAAVGAKSSESTESGSWLRLSPVSRELDGGCKAPKLLVEVKMAHAVVAAAAPDHAAVAMRGTKLGGASECCSGGEHCGHCGWIGSEEDMFLAATFTQ